MPFLYEKIDAYREGGFSKELPQYIPDNLNPNFELRPYQTAAFENFITYFENDKLVTMVRYYEMSDETWKTDDYTYQYRLEITGRMNNSTKDSTFVFLSNIKDITFEQAWKASGFSSNMDDYFDEEDAKFVAMK